MSGASATICSRRSDLRSSETDLNLVTNLVAFKVAWASTMFGAANGLPLLGPAIVMIAIAIHLRNALFPGEELMLVAATGVLGACWDSILVSIGWMTYPSGTFISGVAPYWIIGMWMLFATTLNIAFRWLREKLLLAALTGAIFGPLSYYVGAKFGAVVISQPVAALTALAIGWSVIFPLLLVLAKKLDGFQVTGHSEPVKG